MRLSRLSLAMSVAAPITAPVAEPVIRKIKHSSVSGTSSRMRKVVLAKPTDHSSSLFPAYKLED